MRIAKPRLYLKIGLRIATAEVLLWGEALLCRVSSSTRGLHRGPQSMTLRRFSSRNDRVLASPHRLRRHAKGLQRKH
ncbi:hypothetical protein EDD37DRAFT_66776 [Exophiala viscosa]|uniref:uncharacterized protein n=1 Tax=Exophiala viscosa TaxID=2486360 RepID=UPI0021A20842|nr:hypothetical protein EDD37DRAFT_66776 [Exophiala viscosa]